MIGTGVKQLLRDVPWGELDYLILDLPPGTSDAAMTAAQDVPLAGAIIVSTPQQVALEDAAKAIAMFEKLTVPVLGIIENMSYFITPDTGQRLEIFGHGGAEAAAEEHAIDFLGAVPLATEIRAGGDEGRPIVEFDPGQPRRGRPSATSPSASPTKPEVLAQDGPRPQPRRTPRRPTGPRPHHPHPTSGA